MVYEASYDIDMTRMTDRWKKTITTVIVVYIYYADIARGRKCIIDCYQ